MSKFVISDGIREEHPTIKVAYLFSKTVIISYLIIFLVVHAQKNGFEKEHGPFAFLLLFIPICVGIVVGWYKASKINYASAPRMTRDEKMVTTLNFVGPVLIILIFGYLWFSGVLESLI